MKIILDAGHGYNTEGKRSVDGMREYEFNRKVAGFARPLLEVYQNVTVYFAHSDERDVPLQERTDLANRLKADVFLSIHANAYGTTWNDANGIETFIHSTKPKGAYELAQKVQQQLVALTRLRDRGVKTADFHVLRETKMTAILVECGFMTNKHEAGLLRTEDYQRTCAQGIVHGIIEQYHLVKKLIPPQEGFFKVQAGTFSIKANADALAVRLKSSGMEAMVETENNLHKVVVGGFPDKQSAEALATRLKAEHIQSMVTLNGA